MASPVSIFNTNLADQVALAATVLSKPQFVGNVDGYSIQTTWSNGASITNAEVSLQCSNDGLNFSDIEDSTIAVSGASGTNMFNVTVFEYLFVRVKYTQSTGTGNLTIICVGNDK